MQAPQAWLKSDLMLQSKTLVSITSVPRRFDTALRTVVASLENIQRQVVLALPSSYTRFGACSPPSYVSQYKNVVVHAPRKDYGPATKLLGGLDYIAASGDRPDYLITLDDDCVYNDPLAAIEALEQAAAERPSTAITMGGIKLDRPPYSNKDGLFHNNVGYVDAVLGWRGVIYPVAPLMADSRIFDMLNDLPDGTHNDDIYFGIALSRMNIPIYSISSPKTTRDGRKLVLEELETGGPSAVQEAIKKDRRLHESDSFSYAVEKGWLPSPFATAQPISDLEKALRRNRYGRKIVHAIRK